MSTVHAAATFKHVYFTGNGNAATTKPFGRTAKNPQCGPNATLSMFVMFTIEVSLSIYYIYYKKKKLSTRILRYE